MCRESKAAAPHPVHDFFHIFIHTRRGALSTAHAQASRQSSVVSRQSSVTIRQWAVDNIHNRIAPLGSLFNEAVIHFISRKHKICHSERSEESAGARPPRPQWGDLGGLARAVAVAGPTARQPRPDPPGNGFFAAFRMTSSLLFLLIFMSAHDRRAAQGAKLVGIRQ